MREVLQPIEAARCDSYVNRTWHHLCLLPVFLAGGLLVLLAGGASAQTAFTLQRSLSLTGTYVPGTPLDVTVTLSLSTSQTLTAIGLEETVPSGWGYVGGVSGELPAVAPLPGTSGLLEFAWFPLPSLPLTFTYRIAIPAGATGLRVITGQGLCRLRESGERRTTTVLTVIPSEDSGKIHTADQDGNNQISLSELLRIIQFFNTAGLHCEEGTEDGYAPGPGGTGCTPHDSDYAPQDWSINLTELLRIIQFFNIGLYHSCPEQLTEDGYCPGID